MVITEGQIGNSTVRRARETVQREEAKGGPGAAGESWHILPIALPFSDPKVTAN